jgi:hypothetical protein
LIVENSAKIITVRENISLPGEISTSAVNEIDARKFALGSYFLCPQMFF